MHRGVATKVSLGSERKFGLFQVIAYLPVKRLRAFF